MSYAGRRGAAVLDAPMTNIVDGEIRNVEPASGAALPPVRVSTPDDVREAVARAREAQRAWLGLGFDGRRRKLLAFRDLVYDRSDEIIEILMRQNGKPRFEAMHEVLSVLDFAHYFPTRAKRILRRRRIWLHLLWPLKRSYIEYVPRGVVGVIAPWNFPFWIPIADVLVALSAGNAVVLKPSEWAPHSALLAKALFDEAGLDPDLVTVVCGAGDVGAALVDAEPDMIVFTGSVASGRKVAGACGQRLIPFIAELGGKDPVIVLPDADLDQAASHVVNGAFYNCGQTCASMERVLVHDSIYEPFVDRLVEITSKLRVGDPIAALPGHTDIGPLVIESQLQVVDRHLADAIDKGARVLVGGRATAKALRGRFFEPAILVDVNDDMLCWREETFGPLLPIRKFTEIDDAIRIANDTPYGLNAYVYAGNTAHAEDLALRLEAGSIVVNDFLTNAGAPETPWGGVKSSGMGRVHGLEGMRDMCDVRHVFVPRIGWSLPLRYPYREGAYRFFFRWLRGLYRGLTSRLL